MSVTIHSPATDRDMNLANRNFATFWNALGLDAEEYGGDEDPRVVLEALARFDVTLCLRTTTTSGNMTSMGITEDQVDRYVGALTDIASAALCEGERVHWG